MVRGIEGNEMSTQKSKKTTPKPSQGGFKQQGIAGFFKPATTPSQTVPAKRASPSIETAPAASTQSVQAVSRPVATPSSPLSVTVGSQQSTTDDGRNKENETPGTSYSSPPRKARKQVSYAESATSDGDDDDEPIFRPVSGNGRANKRRRVSKMIESEDEFEPEAEEVKDDDDGNEDVTVAKSKPSLKTTPTLQTEESEEIPTESTAQIWKYDSDNLGEERPSNWKPAWKMSSSISGKPRDSEPEKRRIWLADVRDADQHAPDHPDYDPRTIFIPPNSFRDLSAFEKQYWNIKKSLMDTIVFFKKGKFYELYENDATIGHQLFDLKLTDRVNMRMVGVPEASLDHWANQFVAKGYKIARVDQMETKLGKDMRERDEQVKKGKDDKVINRELSTILTAGTLVDGGMLQGDMATYCVAIKETEVEGRPRFGIAFVDAATAQFNLAEFNDDADMTQFETFVAQVQPGELLLEKGNVSAKTLRILKNNTSSTTIWNYLKPEKEFLSADRTRMEIDGAGYFDDKDELSTWPAALEEAKSKPAVLSAFGALLSYLKKLMIEKSLITCRNFIWYDPIRKATSLVLDGQSLINLEIFANTFDGSSAGTLFTMLNRCVTPFGKRMLKQWVCHPLADVDKINQRFDAVDALNADGTVMERFTASLARMPDLERLISRIHASSCKPQDFLRVLEGFEQIDYTMSMLGSFGKGDGVLGKLITAMPDLASALNKWKDAFDRGKARTEGLFLPQPGVEEDFDESQERKDGILKSLDQLLNRYRKELGSSTLKYTDSGKEIYQLEVPSKVKAKIPASWKQMSATQACKRWYSPELENLVQDLKEAEEMHNQTLKELSGRYCARFDEDYQTWLAAVKIVAQLDCLISLAKASTALGSPSCRPEFVESKRSVLHFDDLRHPCIETTTTFIPNDIKLGGESASMTLLTGANAAGKSTVLRMTCIAVILAQIGCYVPAQFAQMTPVDRIMSRLGAHDNIFAGQSTFMVELSETKKILSEATPRSLVILDELGRGTSSYDGVAVAQAVLHHVATHVGALGFFATHYHSLAAEFMHHPEVVSRRMAVRVEHDIRDVTFLYKLEDGVAEGSYGMHCAAMCGIPAKIIDNAEKAAQSWEHTERIKESLEKSKGAAWLPLGLLSDLSWIVQDTSKTGDGAVSLDSLEILRKAVEAL